MDRVPFVEALNVMNRALDEHRDSFPYKQILGTWERVLGGKDVGIAVYADDASAPFDFYTVRFEKGKLEFVQRGKGDCEIVWKVSRDYLQRIADDPEPYVKHPEKLDWDWIVDRLGLRRS